ncbi:hypothetical protein V8C40DRAFT_230950 [Trichoderma camerunense]
MKHCPLFLGLWANWIGLGIHGMAWQLDYLISPTLVYIFCYPFLYFFCFFFMFGIWVYIFLDGLYQALGSSVRARRTTSCAWCCIRCHSVMSYLGLLFLLTLLLAFGHACTAVDGYDLCSTAIVFLFSSFFSFCFVVLHFFPSNFVLLFSLVVLSPVD